MKAISWLIGISVPILPFILFANGPEDGENTSSEPPIIVEQITVSAERSETTIKETTAKVTVISDLVIQERLINDTRDLFKYEPGIYVSNDGGRLGLNGINIRGIGGNRVLTQVDGIRSAEQFDFGPLSAHQITIDVDSLRSVEVIRGTASSLYGSDALGGVVSFVTKDPVHYLNEWGKSNGFQVKTGYDGKNDMTNLHLTGAFTFGEYQALLSVGRRDYEARDNQGVIAAFDDTRTTPNDIDGESLEVLAKLVRQTNDGGFLRLTAEVYDAESLTNLYTSQGVSSPFGFPVEVANASADDTSSRLRLSIDQSIQGMDAVLADSLTWKLYSRDSKTEQTTLEDQLTQLGPASTNIRRTGRMDFEQESFGAEVVVHKNHTTGNSDLRITYGASFERSDFGQVRDRRDLDLNTNNPDAYTGSLIFPTRYFPNSEVDEVGAFVQAEAYFFGGKLKVIPSMRYDRFKLSPDQNDTIYLESTGTTERPAGLDNDAISPKLGVFVEITDHLAWTGQYAEGFRAPAYSSVNSGFTNINGGYQTLPNPDLETETSQSMETGIKLYGKKGSLSLHYFDNEFNDFIEDSVFVGISQTGLATFQAQNMENVSIEGFEVTGDYLVNENWSLLFSYADIEGENSDTGAPLESIEPRKGCVGYSVER